MLLCFLPFANDFEESGFGRVSGYSLLLLLRQSLCVSSAFCLLFFHAPFHLFSDIFWDSSRMLAIVSEVLGHGTSSVWCQELQRCCLSEGEKGNLALPVVESYQYWYGMWISAWKIQQRSSQGRRGTTNWVGYLKPRQGASDAVAATTVVYFRQSSDLRT